MIPRNARLLALALLAVQCPASAAGGRPAPGLLRGLAGGELPEVPPVAGAPVPSPEEHAAERACRSADPVLVVDNFSTMPGRVRPYIDADGDGTPDVGHGEIVAALYRATGKRVLKRNMDLDGSIENLVRIVGRAAAELEAGTLRISAVNLSQVTEVSLEGLNRDLAVDPPATPAEIGARRAELARAVRRLMDEAGSPAFGKLGEVFARLRARGVPVLFAAGNAGPEKINLLGMLPGAISVGSLRPDGSKAGTSADSSLVGLWRRGEHGARRVPGGLDLDGDGRPDLDAERLSGGPSAAERYAGRPAAELIGALPSGPDWDMFSRESEAGVAYLIEHLPERLYRAEELAGFFKLPPHRRRALVARGPLADKSMRFSFGIDAAGRVVYDPAGTGAPGQVALLSGTSFAAPFLCGR